jgi:predicted site-specific integrase-resolvase
MLTLEEMAHALGVSTRTVHIWRVHGLVRGHAYTDKRDRLYEPPPTHAPKKAQGVKLSSRILSRDLVLHGRKEVQCET